MGRCASGFQRPLIACAGLIGAVPGGLGTAGPGERLWGWRGGVPRPRGLGQRRLGGIPELGQRTGRRGGRLDGGGVHGRGDAQAAGAEPPGHVLLRGRGPCVVVLAVDDQHRDLIEPRQLGRPVRRGEHVPGHQDQPVRAVAQHPSAEERDDMAGDSGRDGLRGQVGLPELGDPGPELSRIRSALVTLLIPGPIPAPFPGLFPAPRASSIASIAAARSHAGRSGDRAGAHQGERGDLRTARASTTSRPVSPPWECPTRCLASLASMIAAMSAVRAGAE